MTNLVVQWRRSNLGTPCLLTFLQDIVRRTWNASVALSCLHKLLKKAKQKPTRRKMKERYFLLSREAPRIKTLLISRPSKTNGSLEYHLKRCGIRKETIVGIEHLILEPMRILERRQAHRNLIVMEQENQMMSVWLCCPIPNILVKRTTCKKRRSRSAMAA